MHSTAKLLIKYPYVKKILVNNLVTQTIALATDSKSLTITRLHYHFKRILRALFTHCRQKYGNDTFIKIKCGECIHKDLAKVPDLIEYRKRSRSLMLVGGKGMQTIKTTKIVIKPNHQKCSIPLTRKVLPRNANPNDTTEPKYPFAL